MLHSDPDTTAGSTVSELGDFTAPASWNSTQMKDLGMAHGTVGRGRRRTNFPEALGIVVPAAVKPVLLDRLETNFGFTRATIYGLQRGGRADVRILSREEREPNG